MSWWKHREHLSQSLWIRAMIGGSCLRHVVLQCMSVMSLLCSVPQCNYHLLCSSQKCEMMSVTEWHRAQWVLWLTALHTPALWYFHALQMLSRLTCGETHLFWTQPFTLMHKTLDLTLVGSWDVLQRLYPSNRIRAVTGNTGAVLWCRPYRHIQAGAGHWVQA